MAGIVITVGGRNDGSLKRALDQDLLAAKAAATQMQLASAASIAALNRQLTGVNRSLAKATPGDAVYGALQLQQLALIKRIQTEETAAFASGIAARNKIQAAGEAKDIGIWKLGQAEWNRIQAEETAAMLARFEQQRIAAAAVKAEQLAMLTAVATAGTVSSGLGHGGGGITGIIRESLVIMREISMGRGTGRIGGSITLLAQYLGVLKLAVKSTASESILAAAAQDKLASSMAREALVAEAALATAKQSTTANAENIVVLEAETIALREKAVAQALVAKEMNLAKDIQVAGAVTRLNPLFFGTVGIIAAVGVAAFVAWRHFKNLAVETKNLADAMNPLKKSFTDLAIAEDKTAKAAQENVDWLKKLNDQHLTESDQLERKIKLLHMEAEARRKTMEAHGASESELQAFDMASLENQKKMLEAEQKKIEYASRLAQQQEQAASDADVNGATMTDEKGRVINLQDAQDRAKRLGEILDAAQTNSNDSFQQTSIDKLTEQKRTQGGNAVVPTSQDISILGTRSQFDMTIDKAIAQLTKSMNGTAQDIKVGGKKYSISIEDAQKNFQLASDQAKKLATDQKKLDDILENAKSTAKEKQDALVKVQTDLQDVNDQIGIKSTDPTLKKDARPEVTARERVGFGEVSSPIMSIAQQQLQANRQQVEQQRITNGFLKGLKFGAPKFDGQIRPDNSGFDDMVGGGQFS